MHSQQAMHLCGENEGCFIDFSILLKICYLVPVSIPESLSMSFW